MTQPYIIRETDDFYPLSVLFNKNGLEVAISETPPENIIKMWRLDDPETGALLGAVTLQIRAGVYTLGDMAVEEIHRQQGLGKIMQQLVFDEAKQRGITEVWCTAKIPEYYEHCGWECMDWNTSPMVVVHCDTCQKRGKTCFPEIIRITL